IGSCLNKLFEDGVVKREEILQPTLEVEIARHACWRNWRRERRKKTSTFKKARVGNKATCFYGIVWYQCCNKAIGSSSDEVQVFMDYVSSNMRYVMLSVPSV
ncbi:hypothetical protein Tco_0519666, partial [Tanacetum coccineum]